MSLDVYLSMPGSDRETGSGIFIRENGSMREVTREEWDAKFPGCEPVLFQRSDRTDEVYSRNITHNLGRMAEAAGIYRCMWRPDEIGIEKAGLLVEPLRVGLTALKADPDKFKALNPSNGWGDYDGLVAFVADYLRACEENPDAHVIVSR